MATNARTFTSSEVRNIIKGLTKQYITFTVPMARIAGGATAGLMLERMIQLSTYSSTKQKGGWFWKSHTEWTEDTCMTRGEQRSAISKVVKRGLVETKVKGTPATTWFRVDHDEVMAQLVNLTNLMAANSTGSADQQDGSCDQQDGSCDQQDGSSDQPNTEQSPASKSASQSETESGRRDIDSNTSTPAQEDSSCPSLQTPETDKEVTTNVLGDEEEYNPFGHMEWTPRPPTPRVEDDVEEYDPFRCQA